MEQDQTREQSELSKIGNGDNVAGTTGSYKTSTTEGTGRIPTRENDSEQSSLSIESEDSTLSTPQSLEEAAKSIKRPIFIATAEGHIAEKVEKILFAEGYQDKDHSAMSSGPLLNKDEYVLLIVNPEIYQGLYKQYLFSLMKEDERARVQQVAINEELKQKAVTQALQIQEFILNWNDARNCIIGSGKDTQIVFNEKELRVILNKMKHLGGEKGRLTHQDTWNIMDLLLLQGFISLDNVLEEMHNRETRKYRLIISNQDRLNHIIKQRDQSLYLQGKYKDQEDSLNHKVEELEIKIQKEQQDVKS